MFNQIRLINVLRKLANESNKHKPLQYSTLSAAKFCKWAKLRGKLHGSLSYKIAVYQMSNNCQLGGGHPTSNTDTKRLNLEEN